MNSELSIEVRVPKLFFGEEKRVGGADGASLMFEDEDEDDDDDDDDDSDNDKDGDDADSWLI